MGFFKGAAGANKTDQEIFNELCASTIKTIVESSIGAAEKQQLANQFLLQAQAFTEDKSCDVLRETRRASVDALEMVRIFGEIQNRRAGK